MLDYKQAFFGAINKLLWVCWSGWGGKCAKNKLEFEYINKLY